MRSFRLKQIGQVMSENTPNPNSSDDSGFNNTQYALTEDGILKVYRVGVTTVLGFGGEDIPSEFNAAHYRAAITDLLRANNSEVVAFDLTGAKWNAGFAGLAEKTGGFDTCCPGIQSVGRCPRSPANHQVEYND